MNQVRKSPASKGQFKCFSCRSMVRSKDGAWSTLSNQQVFLCKPCQHPPVTARTPSGVPKQV